MSDHKPYLSVVIPIYNEEEVLPTLFKRLFPALDKTGKSYEVIFTNDGSKDKSIELLKEMQDERPAEVKIIDFNRNFGQHMAIMAGFEHVSGDVIVTMDADLQNYPEDIPLLLEKIEAGHDVVGGYRMDRQDKKWRLFVSKLHNSLRLKLTGVDMVDEGCMLRAYTREVIDRVVATGENSTFLPALAHSFSSNPTDVGVRHAAREEGTSSYNLYKLIRYNFDFFANFSKAPLEFFTMSGFIVAFISILLFVYLIVKRVIFGPDADGVFTLFAVAYFLIGMLLMGLGIVGEYIGRIYEEVRKRPRFIVREYLDTDQQKKPKPAKYIKDLEDSLDTEEAADKTAQKTTIKDKDSKEKEENTKKKDKE
ncbi:glycosyltransferase [Fangia hongkongensis]|uniref:glycosyltransferase n=1 Tax=Fangia hongkongensis TaxID=270495 RepID=UPI000370EC3A|nr:glycosyltransferase [Fangia hongkongensis]MBK2126042.1 glycosyltransferase [Fangia hongkongensis]